MKILYIPLDFHLHKENPELFTDLNNALGGEIYESFDQAVAYNPDVILFQGSLFPSELNELQRATKAKVFMWTGDCRYIPQESLMKFKNVVDVYLLPFKGKLLGTYAYLLGKPCHFMWEPIQTWRFIPWKNLESGPITFIGNIYGHFPGGESRSETMGFLNTHIDSLKIYGSFPGCSSVENRRVPQIYNDSYAVIAENNMHDIDSYFTPRNIGAMAAGSCVLMKRFPEINEFFTNGYDCFIYRHKYELLEIIQFLQKYPSIRNTVAGNGYNAAILKFSVHEFAYQFKQIAA